MKRRSVIVVGSNGAEVKIYTLRRQNGYLSHQCAWYDLGRRQTKTYANLEDAKLFAQRESVRLKNGLPVQGPEVSVREIELLRACENRAGRFGLTVAAAMEEWFSAKTILNGGALCAAAQHYQSRHASLLPRDLDSVTSEFLAAKDAAGLSKAHRKSLKERLGKIQRLLGNLSIGDVTTAQVDAALRGSAGSPRTKNNLRNALVGLFRWAQEQDYLPPDRKTAPERAMRFSGTERAPAIFTPEQMRKILAACSKQVLAHVAIGAFAGIRTAEIARLEWQDVLWDRGYIEIKTAKAKTKARRLVPLHANLRDWLERCRQESGPICRGVDLAKISRDSGVLWESNALRHSYASYRLAQVQDAAKVALEMGNSPQMLFRHYRELVTPEAAAEWFSILPC